MKPLLLALGLAIASTPASACRLALALGLDVSGSVDPDEYRLQLGGLATAFEDPDVQAALFDPSGAVRIVVYEWSGPEFQRIIVPWTEMSPADVLSVTLALRSTERAKADPSTAIGTAMQVGHGLLAQQPDCFAHTIDISGDGKSNTGPRPQDVTLGAPATTVNALVIADDGESNTFSDMGRQEVSIGELSAYFHAYVLRGPGSFVETALGYDDYAEAIKRKLLRELAVMVLGQASESPATR